MSTASIAPTKARSRERLDACNRVLGSFSRVNFSLDARGRITVHWIRLSGTQVTKVWIAMRGSPDYPAWHKRASWGGTQSRAMAQLVRWWRGQTVLPMETWEYWASDTVKLCKPETLTILREVGWPEKVPCVLCGRTPPAGLDWWDLDKVSGPCCSFSNLNGCRQEGKCNSCEPRGGGRP